MIAAVRLIWVSVALLIIYIEPSEPNRNVEITYTALILYTAYSACLYFFLPTGNKIVDWVNDNSNWLDIAWFTILIALSNGTNSTFFFGFFFAVIITSFRSGFASGLIATVTSVFTFTFVALKFNPAPHEISLIQLLLRPTNLLVLGYIMSYWGGRELKLKGQLRLLKEVATLSNPRFGIDHTIGSAIERLRAFYKADTCLLIVFDKTSGNYRLHRASRRNPEDASRAQPITSELADLMLSIPSVWAVVYGAAHRLWPGKPRFNIHNIGTGERVTTIPQSLNAIAGTLDGESFASIPVLYHKESVGRLYLIAQKKRNFDNSDIEFFLQVIEQIAPVVDNIQLVDRLASDAAEQERQKIARDIHDGVIQPYIGLQIGLVGLKQKLGNEEANISGAIDKLIELTDAGIQDLRQYVYGLKEAGERESSLVPAMRRFSSRFAQTTGIQVDLDIASEIQINDRLAAELFHMVVEGLSNIRRHTQAVRAGIGLRCAEGQVHLTVENDGIGNGNGNGGGHRVDPLFVPHSLSGRTQALGGEIKVESRGDGGTIVRIDIPL